MSQTTAHELPIHVRKEIAVLAEAELGELRSRYRKVLRQPPLPHLPGWLLVRIIAYRLQERALGGIGKVSERFLNDLAHRVSRSKKAGIKLDTKAIMALVPAVPRAKGLQPGAQLVREYNGVTHQINVTKAGFEWNGAAYGSLSEIASAITGTNWNGPRFFGLREKAKSRAPKDDRQSGAIWSSPEGSE